MTITVEETPKSRSASSGDQAVYTLKYIVTGTENENDAMNALIAEAGTKHPRASSLVRNSWDVDPISGTNKWYGTVRFVSRTWSGGSSNDSVFSFDTMGGTQHITQSYSTQNRYAPPGKTAPNHYGAIGVANGRVQGVDIVVPVYNFSERHYLSNDTVTEDYKQIVSDLTGKTNNWGFRGYSRGEVLFRGAQGTQVNGDDWEIVYHFSASKNQTDLTIGTITGIAKWGWEYLWVLYDDEVDSTAKALVKRPSAVYIETVYKEGNFDSLGIS